MDPRHPLEIGKPRFSSKYFPIMLVGPLINHFYRLDQEMQKQQEFIYTQDFQIQQLERKIRRAQGERTDEEQEVLTQKIDLLQIDLDEVTKKAKLLNGEWKKSQDDQRQAKIRLEKLQDQKKKLVQSLDSLNLYNDSAASMYDLKLPYLIADLLGAAIDIKGQGKGGTHG
jgi:hypothetical protein